MSSSMNPPDPYGTGDQPSGGSGQPDGSTPYGSSPSPYGSTPPSYGSTPPPYGSTPPPYGEGQPPAYGSAPSPYGSQPQYGGGYGSPSPYGQPGLGYPRNSLGVWSLVLGLVGFFLCGPLASIGSLITGSMAKKAVRNGEANNGGLATAGIIISWVTIGLWLIGLLWLFAFGGLAWYIEQVESTTSTTTF